ncbi:annexin XIV [Pseudohyphozyma bogoriensis]|nr:annexin XIV [Pseudohyphozyma bogoriensis]
MNPNNAYTGAYGGTGAPPAQGYQPQAYQPQPQGYNPQGHNPQQGYSPAQGYGAPPGQTPYTSQPGFNTGGGGYGGGGYNPQYPQQPGYGAQPGGFVQQGQPQPAYHQGPPQMGSYAASQQIHQQAGPPRTYLGTMLHPSENPLLGPHEQVMSSVDGYNPDADVEKVYKACKGIGTNEKQLNATIIPLPAVRLPVLKNAYRARHAKAMEEVVKSELGGHYKDLMYDLLRGPLYGDVHFVHKACSMGTNEELLTELIIGRTPSSMDMLRRRLFRDCAYLRMLRQDLEALKQALGFFKDDEVRVASILFGRSPAFLHQLQLGYLAEKKQTLTKAVKKHFNGHLCKALLYALEGGKKDTTGCWRDAKFIHKTMAGPGTKDELLTIRVLRAHWNKARFAHVQTAYLTKYKKTMEKAIKGDTSGDFEDGLVALLH